MPRQATPKLKRPRGLTLHPMTVDEALRRMLTTPLPPSERRTGAARRKKRAEAPTEEE